jgi:hypothetical protein
MGQALSTAQQNILNRFLNNPNPNEINNLNNNFLFGNNSDAPGTANPNTRLNFINQLISISNSSARNRKSKSNQNAALLNDFQNIQFGSNFFLAGHKFKNLVSQAQTFLFGDQLDLAFIVSHKPVVVRLEFYSFYRKSMGHAIFVL